MAKKKSAAKRTTHEQIKLREEWEGWTHEFLRNGWYRIFNSEGKPIITVHGDAELTALLLQAPKLLVASDELVRNIPTAYTPDEDGDDENSKMTFEHRMQMLRELNEAIEEAQKTVSRR